VGLVFAFHLGWSSELRLTTSEDASNPFLSLLRPIRSAMPKNTNDVRSEFYEEVTADRCAQDPATRAQV
jgi:hypothetical protein